MGLGMTASDPCLAGVLHVCSFVLFTIWVTPENRLAKLALRGSSVLTQYFRGPQMARDSGWVKTLSVHVHKPAVTEQQNGDVLGQVTRSITLKPGTALFFPLLNSEFDNTCGRPNLGGNCFGLQRFPAV